VRLRDLVVDACVPESATFGDAIAVLAGSDASAVAVVSGEGRVVGLLDPRQILRGLFPAYLGELTHTAFAEDDRESIRRRRRGALGEPVSAFMADPVTVGTEVSFTHVAERFMHSSLQGLAVVERGRYVGVVSLEPLVRSLLRTAQ
jgi:CBS domain-containing protein